MGTSQHGRGGKESLVPLAAIELPARPVGDQIELVHVEAVSVGVLQTCGQVGLGGCVGAMAQRAPGEVDPNAADLLLDSGARRLLTARLESSAGEGIPAQQGHPVQRDARVQAQLAVADTVGERDRAKRPLARGVCILGILVECRQHRTRGHERAAGRTALQQRHRTLGRLERLGDAARAPKHVCERGQRACLAQVVAELAMTDEGALERLDRARGVVDEKALARLPLQQIGSRCGRLARGEPQRSGVLGGRLAVGAMLGRVRRGRRSEAQHRVPVSRRLRVMRQPRQIGRFAGRSRQRGERPAVQRQPLIGRQRLLDRQPREFVAVAHSVPPGGKHPRGEALIQAIPGLGRERLEQPQLHLARDNGERLQPASCRTAEPRDPGHHRIAHRRRDLLTAGGEHLGDEERIAPGHPVQFGRVQP